MTHYCNHCETYCDLVPYQDKVMAMATGVTRWAVKCRKCSHTTTHNQSIAKAYEEWVKDNPDPAKPGSEGTPLQWETHPIHLYCKYCNAERTIEIRREPHCYSMWCSQCSATVSRVNTDTQPTEEEMRALWAKHNQKPPAGCGPPAPHTVEDTLKVRIPTNGNLPDQAQCSQELKDVVRRFQMSWSKLTHCQREALDMILHKIGRVIAGNADYADHWHDIAGYAMLVEKEIKKGNVRITPTL